VLLPPPSTPATADPMQMKQMMKRVYEMIPQQQVQPQTTVMFATQQQPPSLQPQQQPAAQRSGGVPMDQSGSVSTGGAVVMMKLELQPNQQHGGVIPASGGGDKTGVPMDLVSQQKAQIHMQIQYLEQQKLQLEENLALIEYNNRMLHSNERAKTQPVGMSMHMQAPGMSAMPSVNSLPLATPAYGRVPTGTSGWPLPTAAPTAAIPQAVSQPLPSRNLGGGGVSASSPTNSTSSGVQQGPRSTQDGLPSPPPSSQSSPSPSRSLQPLPDSSGTISSPTMISQSVASTTSAQHHHQVVHPMMMQSSHQLHHQLMNPPPQQQPPMAFPMYAAYGAQPTSGQQGNLNQPPLAQTITTTRQFNASGPQQQQQQQRASSQDLTAPMNNLFYQPNGSPSAVDQQQQQYQTSVYQQQMHQAAHQQQMQHQMNYLFSQQQLQHHLQQQAQPMMHHHVYQTQLAAPTSSPGQAPSGQSLQMQSIQVLHASPTQQQYSISGVSASSSTGGGGSIGGGGGVSSITMSPMPSLSYPSYHGTYFSPNPNSDSSSLSLLAVASTTFDHAGRAISATAATEQSGRAVSATTMPTHHLHASSQASMHSGKPTPLVSLSSFTQQSGESPAGGAAAGGGAYIGPFLHGGTQFMLSPSMMQTQTQSTLKLYVPSGALHSSPSSSFYQPSSGQSSAVSSSHRTPFLDGSPNTANPSPDGSEENNDSSSSSSDITTDEDQHMQDDSTTMQQQQHASQPQHEQHAHPVKVEPMQH
jgi:hypothetical protein